MTVEIRRGKTPAGGVKSQAAYVNIETMAEVDKAEATGIVITEVDADDHVIAETVAFLKPGRDTPAT